MDIRIIGLAILLILGLSLDNDDGPPDYVALGDSLAAGLAAFGSSGYVNRYHSWLKQTHFRGNFRLYNAGVPGLKSIDLLSLLNSRRDLQVKISTAQIITIDIGANDIATASYSEEALGESAYRFELNLNGILSQIRRLNPKARLYVMDIYNPYPTGHTMHEAAERWILRFNKIIWHVCGEAYYQVNGIAGVYAAFKGNEQAYTWILIGNKHPNSEGHRVIAQCFADITK